MKVFSVTDDERGIDCDSVVEVFVEGYLAQYTRFLSGCKTALVLFIYGFIFSNQTAESLFRHYLFKFRQCLDNGLPTRTKSYILHKETREKISNFKKI